MKPKDTRSEAESQPPPTEVCCISDDLENEADSILIDQAIDVLVEWMIAEHLSRHPNTKEDVK